MVDDIVTWYCSFCYSKNSAIRGQCRCEICGQPRGAKPNV